LLHYDINQSLKNLTRLYFIFRFFPAPITEIFFYPPAAPRTGHIISAATKAIGSHIINSAHSSYNLPFAYFPSLMVIPKKHDSAGLESPLWHKTYNPTVPGNTKLIKNLQKHL
jgi:hypothetical protein